MKQVAYSVKFIGKEENIKIGSGKGGYIAENTLFIPQYSTRTQKPYLRTFDISKLSVNTDGSVSGYYTEVGEYEGRAIQRTYYIWYTENAE